MKLASMLLVAVLSIGSEEASRAQVLAAASLPENPVAEAVKPASTAAFALATPIAGTRNHDAADAPASTTTVVAPSHPGSTTLSPWQTKLDRVVHVDDLAFSFRYRNDMLDDGVRAFDNGQQKSLVVADVKLDPGAKYSVHFRVSSGRTFNWSYTDVIGDDTSKRGNNPAAYLALSPEQLVGAFAAVAADPAGVTNSQLLFSRGGEMSFRELYFRAAPVKEVAVEFGSLGIEKGTGTEATTYDDDGYITGERVRFFDPKHLFFDQVAATFAYEGDIVTPNFFSRGQRLKQDNYRQFLVAKKFGDRFKTSADYTFDKGTHTVREAVFVKIPEVKAIDSIRLELYERLNDQVLQGETFYAHNGFAVTGSKTFYKKFQLDGGAARIDTDYGVLTGSRVLAWSGFSMNGDAFLTGTRAFTRANYKAANGFTFFGYYTHTVAAGPPDSLEYNKQGVTGGMTVDLKTLLTKARVL